MHVLDDRLRGRGGAPAGRRPRLAGDRKYRFRWNGRDDDGNVVPDGVYRLRVVQAQGGPRGRLDQGGAGGHQAAAGRASRRCEPNVVVARAGRARGAHPLPRPAQQGARSSACSAPTTTCPVRARCFRGDDSRTRRLGRHRARRRPRARRHLLVQREGARPGRQQDQAPAPVPPSSATAPPRTGVAVRALTLQGPARRGAGGLARACCAVGPARAPLRVRALAAGLAGGRSAGTAAAAGGCACASRSDARTGIYLVRVRLAGGRRAVWPLAVAGLPPRGTPRPAAAARGAAGGHLAGRSTRSTPTSTASPTRSTRSNARARRAAVRRRRPAAAVPLARSRRCCASSTASGCPTTSPPTSRSPAARARRSATRRGWRSRARASGCRAGCATACSRRSRSGGLAVASFGRESLRRTVALDGGVLRNPSPPRPDDLFGERTSIFRVRPARAAARGARRAGPVRRGGRAVRRVLGVRALGPAAARRASCSPRRAARRASRRSWATASARAPWSGPGTPQWARELEESALERGGAARHAADLALLLVRALRAAAARLPSCAPMLRYAADRRRPRRAARGRRAPCYKVLSTTRTRPRSAARPRRSSTTDTPEPPAAARRAR